MKSLIIGVVATFLLLGLHGTGAIACDNAQCNSACLSLGWWGGYCQAGSCWCWKTEGSQKRIERLFSALKTEAGGISTSTQDVNFCQEERCNRSCIAHHWDGGSCRDGLCWCGKIGKSDTPLTKLSDVVPEERGCDPSRCVKDCGGQCEDEKCLCTKATVGEHSPWTLLLDLPTNFRDTEGKDITSCTLTTCLSACKAEQAFSGFCLKNLCWCTLTDEEGVDKRNVRPVIELQAHISDLVTDENRCHPSDCRRQCSNENKNGGAACFYGYCWCDSNPQKIHDKQVRKQKSMHAAE